MKNTYRNLLLGCSILLTITSCNSKENKSDSTQDISEQVKEDNYDYLLDENYEDINLLSELDALSEDDIMYDEDVFGRFDNIKAQQLYLNNKLDNTMYDGMVTDTDAAHYIFYNDDHLRFVNRSDGYAFNLKTNNTFKGDFSVSKYQCKLYNKETTLAVSKENKNPYRTWNTYKNECLLTYVNSDRYLEKNNLSYTSDKILEDETIKDGYAVSLFSIKINNPGMYKKPYYNIAFIKDSLDFSGKEFYLFVMKSTYDRKDDMINLIKSFEVLDDTKGTGIIDYQNMDVSFNSNWSNDTKNYYNKLLTQQRTDWGIYNYGINDNCNYEASLIGKMAELESKMDYTFDILPTYQHVSVNGSQTHFPINQATKHAGGNGFNGKKVLQFTYQFTANNNDCTALSTPMFDIIRGDDDEFDYFDVKDKLHNTLKELASKIATYDGPILFRLNNEMNSDWTSYCAYITLFDTDIFKASWRYLYKLFEDNGVNNCIWIFNPNAISYPMSNWSEDMCFFPGEKYVQALGLTYYENNNANNAQSNTFRKDYTYLYNLNKDVWNKYPWIISEFGCGAGGSASGEMYRSAQTQAAYVEGMFYDFNHREDNPYLQNIKGAVWFSANDSNEKGITNLYELVVSKLPLTIEKFKEGLSYNKEK